MKMKKLLVFALCMALVASISVVATLAYFTDKDSVTNTFTVGKVEIKLDEAKVDAEGKAITGAGAERVTENKYHLIPSHDIDKDPTITVLKDSESAYLRARVTVNNFDDLKTIMKLDDDTAAAKKIAECVVGYNVNLWTDKGWVIDTTADTITYEFRKTTPTEKKAEDQKFVLFTGFDVPEFLTNADLALLADDPKTETVVEPAFNVSVVAYAIQADGFGDDADKAWEAYDNQNP